MGETEEEAGSHIWEFLPSIQFCYKPETALEK